MHPSFSCAVAPALPVLQELSTAFPSKSTLLCKPKFCISLFPINSLVSRLATLFVGLWFESISSATANIRCGSHRFLHKVNTRRGKDHADHSQQLPTLLQMLVCLHHIQATRTWWGLSCDPILLVKPFVWSHAFIQLPATCFALFL